MADFTDAVVFNGFNQSPMEPCTAPTVEQFQELDAGTLIWANIAGEMRVYSYNGSIVQYQVVSLGSVQS